MATSSVEGRCALLGAAVAGVGAAVWYLRRGARERKNWPAGDGRPRLDIYQKQLKAAVRKRPGYQNFPLPYPNTWIFVCPSSKLQQKGVLPLQLWGKHFVIFRDEAGTAGLVDAFCPHMGTHMGYGGIVRGKSLVCPYHEWEFDVKGNLRKMPFGGRRTAEKGIDGCNVRSYAIVERLGMIFAWLHADGEPPQFELDILDHLEKKENGFRALGRIVDPDFMMHFMEPSHNSADWYHFQTVHSVMGQHWQSKRKLLVMEHELCPARSAVQGDVDDNGEPIERPDLLIIDEKLKRVLLFGWINLPGAPRFAETQVRFCGPCVTLFQVNMPFFGKFRLAMLLTPTEPFVTHTEYYIFAGPRWPWLLAQILARAVIRTANQDREVWEHRSHPDPRNPVKGDYNYKCYDKWLSQFYSKSSVTWESAYEDLTW